MTFLPDTVAQFTGNGFSVMEGVSPAIRAGADRQNTTPILNGVRRLTPVECERLQGFPDGWTAHGPDSRRYAALGDAVTVNVAEWIGRRLLEVA